MDIETLRGLVGKSLGTSDWIEIDQRRIDAFADVTEDHQFIHVDPARATSETPFGGTIAHGYLTLSLLTNFAAQVMPEIDGITTQINYGLNRLRFLTPVLAGSRVRAEFTLAAVTEKRARQYLIECDVRVEIEGHEKPALLVRTLGLYI